MLFNNAGYKIECRSEAHRYHNELLVGIIYVSDSDGFYRFLPNGECLSCKDCKDLMHKLSELNKEG